MKHIRTPAALSARQANTTGIRSAAATHLTPSRVMPASPTQRCACGGSCPRCGGISQAGTSLSVSQPGDAAERDADRLASAALDRHIGGFERAVSGNRKPQPRNAASTLPPMRGAGVPLAEPVRQDMEFRFGESFERVRVHHDAAAAQSALSLNATPTPSVTISLSPPAVTRRKPPGSAPACA